jgi:putative DNA primase/helicase
MADNNERIALISAEGGIFEVIAGLYSGGKSNINVILQSHAGEPVRVERQGRSVVMNKPALTFGLTVQPSIIADLAAGNKARFRGNGMLARLLFCIPKSTVGSRDVSRRKPIPDRVRSEYHSLMNQLLAIHPLSDESGKERPRILMLAPDALKAWIVFSQYIESKQGQYGEFHSIQDWTGKLPGAALRIAGLCHVVEHGEATTVINKPTIEKALDLAELLIAHAKAAFAMMGSDPAIPDAKFVLPWILNNGAESFRRNELHTALHGRFTRVDRLISALKVLSERHIISDPIERPTGRRPEIVYMVNPAILKGGNHGLA